MERRTIFFSGRVQGVGFRWTTERCLEGLVLQGYVRNLPDGRVELVLEGQPADIDEGLGRIRAALARNIDAEAAEAGPVTGEFSNFRIRL